MPYAPIIPLIMGAGLGPSATLAHFSEVTQGKVGGRGREDQGREAEIDFICFLSSWRSKCLTTPPTPTLSPLLPPNQQQPPPSSPSSPPHVTPVFWGRNHRLPSCSVSLFFQTPIHVHLPFQHVSHYQSPQSNALQPVFFF